MILRIVLSTFLVASPITVVCRVDLEVNNTINYRNLISVKIAVYNQYNGLRTYVVDLSENCSYGLSVGRNCRKCARNTCMCRNNTGNSLLSRICKNILKPA